MSKVDPEFLAKLVAGMKLKDGCVRPEPLKPDPAYADIIAGMKPGRKELTQRRLREVLGGVKPGDVPGSLRYPRPGKHCYVWINVDGRRYQAHRLVWLYVYGRWPRGDIDHIDRDGTNNRLSNLIEVDRSIQAFNTGLRRNSTSGHKGVHWWITRNKWQVTIVWQGERRFLGYFDTFEDAVAARQAAEIKLLGCTTEELKDPVNRRPKFVRRI
jgi:HNH endonuclease